MSQIFLTKRHPEAGTLNRRIVLHQAFDFLVVQQVAFLRTYVRIGKRLVNFERFSFNPLTVFPIQTLLGNFANIDFRVKVRSKSLVVITGIAVYDVEILNLVEVMLGSISCKNARHTRVKTTTQDSCQASLFKAIFVSPLP
ncbi:unknown [Prevotella sp. CAG:891]|nr:unknown [Prevotella sp. CAG:891]